MEIIANRIREIRKENNLTQAEFGKLLSVSQDNISLWEKGKGFPSIFHVITIAQIFNISTDYILGLKEF
ncbi:MAG: helix-turn-helix transcriptional regulator [Clostridia bacterium]|nr:helix-turn-helix transcriptional regulator [Clostridia bacterium]